MAKQSSINFDDRKFKLALKDLRARVKGNQLAKKVVQYAETIMTAAKKLTPVDFGTLRNSGNVLIAEISEAQIRVQLVFGGAAAPYALVVHERLDVKHTVGQAKFLSTPMRELAPKLNEALLEILEKK